MYTGRVILIFIDYIFGLIELLIGLRIILVLLGANRATPFVHWIYEASNTVLYPFRGIFPSPVLQGGIVLDMSAVVALLIYALIAYLISEFIRYISFHTARYYTENRPVRKH